MAENNPNGPKTDKSESFTRNLGDKIERAGEKVSDAGAKDLGQKIYNVGNKIEHSQDQKKTERT